MSGMDRLTDEALERLLGYDLHDAKGELCRTSDHEDQSWGMSIPACEIIDTADVVKSMARELLAHRRASQAAPAPVAWRGKHFHPEASAWIYKDGPEKPATAFGSIGQLEPLYAAPAPSDHLVSVGKASGLVEARVSLAARQIRQTLRDYGHRCAETSLPELIAADVDAALRKQDEIHAPAPSDHAISKEWAERMLPLDEGVTPSAGAPAPSDGLREALLREVLDCQEQHFGYGMRLHRAMIPLAARIRAALSASPAQEGSQ